MSIALDALDDIYAIDRVSLKRRLPLRPGRLRRLARSRLHANEVVCSLAISRRVFFRLLGASSFSVGTPEISGVEQRLLGFTPENEERLS